MTTTKKATAKKTTAKKATAKTRTPKTTAKTRTKKTAAKKTAAKKAAAEAPDQKDLTIEDISERAILVNFSVGVWRALHVDRSARNFLADAKNADEERLNARKYLIPQDLIKPIKSVATAARRYHKRVTLPWSDSGSRLVAIRGFEAYRKELASYEKLYKREVEAFLKNYLSHVQEQAAALGDLFDETEYPSIENLRTRFHWTVKLMPLPSGADFRFAVTDEVRLQIEKDVRDRLSSEYSQGVASLVEDMVAHLETLGDAIHAAQDGEFKEIRQPLFDKAARIASRVRDLNILEDSRLDAFADRLEAFSGYSAEDLRSSSKYAKMDRADIKGDADALLGDLKDLAAAIL